MFAKFTEDTLSSLGTEIKLGLIVLCNALKCLEHEVELTDISEVGLSAVGADDIVLLDVSCHLLVAPASNVSAVKVLDKIVCTVTCLT